jgi:hypothetical protein
MKKQITGTVAVLSLLFALAVVSVQAQRVSRITAHIPFAFQIGDKTLPAGDYSIKQLSQNALLVKTAGGETSAIAQAPGRVESNAKQMTERLVFRQYGDQYFLAQVWMNRGSAGRELNMTNAERTAAREYKLAQHGASAQVVEIPAR